jgi:hypothetical protein
MLRKSTRIGGLLFGALVACEPVLPGADAAVGPPVGGGLDPLTCLRGDRRLCVVDDRPGAQTCGWQETWGPCVELQDFRGDGVDNDRDGVTDEGCVRGRSCGPGHGGACEGAHQTCVFGDCEDDDWDLVPRRCTRAEACPNFAGCSEFGICAGRTCESSEGECPPGTVCAEGLCITVRCPRDDFEPDDAPGAARPVVPGTSHLRSLCADDDWLTVDATAGHAYRLSFDPPIGHLVTIGARPTFIEPARADFVAEADGPVPILLRRGHHAARSGVHPAITVGLEALGPTLPAFAPCDPGGSACCTVGHRCSAAPGHADTACRPEPRIEAVAFHAFGDFASAGVIIVADADAPPKAVEVVGADGERTGGVVLWVDPLPNGRHALGFYDYDLPAYEIAGPVALSVSNAFGAIRWSAADPVVSPPRVAGEGTRCDPAGAIRACAPGLVCPGFDSPDALRCVAGF